MSRSRLFILGLAALALGGFLAMQVYRSLQARTVASVPATTDVLVAARDIQIGTRIAEADVKVAHYPSAELPLGAFPGKSRRDIVGRGAILPIVKGEFFLPTKVAAENSGSGLPSLIPAGFRAVSVRVNDVVSVAGFVVPGTRVDVLLTGTPPGGKEPFTTTVLENALVLAVGQRLERNSSGDPQTSPVITLQVTPEDAQKLTLATSEGRIQLALRNLIDAEQESLPSVRNSTLYRGATPPEGPPKPHLAKAKAALPPLPTVYSIEVIRGHDITTTKF